MCIIIYQPADRRISCEKIRQIYATNPDGFGFMVAIPPHGIYHVKGVYALTQIENFYKAVFFDFPEQDVVLHFRTASSSDIGQEFCHPFFVNPNLAFVHNGNFFELSNCFGREQKNNKSDTQRFNKQILQRLPPNFLTDSKIKKAIERYCEQNFSKIIFMDNKGKVTIINEKAGIWEDGVWYSNGGIEEYTGYGFSGAYYYNDGDIRHKGGLITPQYFSKEKQKKWEQCTGCKGYFVSSQLTHNYCEGCKSYLALKQIATYKKEKGEHNGNTNQPNNTLRL